MHDRSGAQQQVVRAYFSHLEAREWDDVAALLADDVVYEMPQTRERIRGKSAFLKFNQDYPGDWHLDVRRLICEGPHAAAWIDARVGQEHQDACVWPEPYDPPPGREHLVERW